MRSLASQRNGTAVGSYVYNAQDQRAAKTAGGSTLQFVYDSAGHLIEEADAATGAAIREYIWLDDLPVALVDHSGASPVLYYIHADHLNRPQKITDASANIVWDGAFDPFGNAASITGTIANPLRFPGQYQDTETNLAQNWFRDYDSTIGRYGESDPIGLLGGVNTFGYAYGNPIRFTDASGKCPICFAILLGAAIGAGWDIGWQLGAPNASLNCLNWQEVGVSAGVGGVLGLAGPVADLFLADSGAAAVAADSFSGGAAAVGEEAASGAEAAGGEAAGAGATPAADGASGASDAAQANRLGQHLRQWQDYGSSGTRELENGRVRYYGDVEPASSPGEMSGQRVVREWDPATGGKRTWMETVDQTGRVRSVRPETGAPKVHFIFDSNGNFVGTR